MLSVAVHKDIAEYQPKIVGKMTMRTLVSITGALSVSVLAGLYIYCDTPEIFLKTGFEQRPMLYTQKHLFQALTPKSDYNPHRHGFSIEQVKRFPELLASPVVLANSPTREDVLLAILLATDAYDTPLIAGIKPDGTGNYGEREVETNMVLSVYSRQNFIRYFALLRDMDAFVFVSGRKIEALEDLSGLPLAENCSGLDIDRILQRPKCLG